MKGNFASRAYRDAAQAHRPTDPAALAREARNLAARGLTDRDIGALMQLHPAEVRRLITSDQQGNPHADN